MASQAALKPFTEEALREWVERDNRRRDLEREARQIKAENDLVAKDLLTALKAAGKSELSRGPYVAEIETSRGTVSWKEEFLRVAGSAAATELANAAPTKEAVKIRQVA